MSQIKVAVIEDHDAFREGICHILSYTEGFTCSGAYGKVDEAVRMMPEVDVILLDIHLPGTSGIEGISLLKGKCPGATVLMLTVFDDDDHIFRSILAGADGYILKKTPPAQVLHAIEDVASGGSPMTPYVARKILTLFKQYAPTPGEDYALTTRETEILHQLVLGLDNQGIAEKLFISRETVRNHLKRIYDKLHVHSRSQAVVKAMKEGLV